MRRFVGWSFIVGFAYYVMLFGVFGRIIDRSERPLHEGLHVLVLYILPFILLIAIALKLRPLTGVRGFIIRAIVVSFLSILVCFISLQFAGVVFCIVGRECF